MDHTIIPPLDRNSFSKEYVIFSHDKSEKISIWQKGEREEEQQQFIFIKRVDKNNC